MLRARFLGLPVKTRAFGMTPYLADEDVNSASVSQNSGGYYFFNRLVWLATQSQRPCSKIHVSVKRPRWSYGLPW